MDIDCRPLFASNLFITKIDPLSFNKHEIISSIIRNYELKKERNNWDNKSKLHHYFKDWNNPEFEKINLEQISDIYVSVYKNIIDSLFPGVIKLGVALENITVHKGAGNFMDEHNHVGKNNFLSGIHYIKCDQKSSNLTFVNPLIYSKFPDLSIKNAIIDSINKTDIRNSVQFPFWTHEIQEDEMVVFPQFLNHKVEPSKFEDSDYRIAIVTNMMVF